MSQKATVWPRSRCSWRQDPFLISQQSVFSFHLGPTRIASLCGFRPRVYCAQELISAYLDPVDRQRCLLQHRQVQNTHPPHGCTSKEDHLSVYLRGTSNSTPVPFQAGTFDWHYGRTSSPTTAVPTPRGGKGHKRAVAVLRPATFVRRASDVVPTLRAGCRGQ